MSSRDGLRAPGSGVCGVHLWRRLEGQSPLTWPWTCSRWPKVSRIAGHQAHFRWWASQVSQRLATDLQMLWRCQLHFCFLLLRKRAWDCEWTRIWIANASALLPSGEARGIGSSCQLAQRSWWGMLRPKVPRPRKLPLRIALALLKAEASSCSYWSSLASFQ